MIWFKLKKSDINKKIRFSDFKKNYDFCQPWYLMKSTFLWRSSLIAAVIRWQHSFCFTFFQPSGPEMGGWMIGQTDQRSNGRTCGRKTDQMVWWSKGQTKWSGGRKNRPNGLMVEEADQKVWWSKEQTKWSGGWKNSPTNGLVVEETDQKVWWSKEQTKRSGG